MNSNDVNICRVSKWTPKTEGSRQCRVVLWKRDMAEDENYPYPYVTHLEGEAEEGGLPRDFFWGHYDLGEATKDADFEGRMKALGVEEQKMMWVGVEVFQLIVQDVHVFTDPDKAEQWFEDYTGVPYAEYIRWANAEGTDDAYEYPLSEDYDQTKLFEQEVV